MIRVTNYYRRVLLSGREVFSKYKDPVNPGDLAVMLDTETRDYFVVLEYDGNPVRVPVNFPPSDITA